MAELIKTYGSYRSAKQDGIRCEINTPSGSYPLHRHDYFELEIIAEGEIIHELNGAREVLSAGAVVSLSPADLHRFTVLAPVRILSFCIYYKDAPRVVQKIVSNAKFPFRASLGEDELEQVFLAFDELSRALADTGDYRREMIGARATLLLVLLLRSAKEHSAVRSSGGFLHISRAMEYIAENCTLPITLEEVAATIHLTPSYFSKLFAEINGSGFVKYLTEQRVEHAKLLLTTTNDTVTDIAFASGFGSFSSFSRAFRAVVGVTPNEYRKYAKEK